MDKLILRRATTFKEAIALLDKVGTGFLPVTNEKNILIGVLTDGDIRRAFLNNVTDLSQIINKSPFVAKTSDSIQEIKGRLKKLHRRHMPIVNNIGELVDVVFLESFESPTRDTWVVIMAGGLGSRLGELTKDIPKPMLPVAGRPILERIITGFSELGFRRFVLCLNYKAEVIKDFFGNGSKFDVEIKYTHEQKRMGTAGALSLIDFEISENFFVLNGDVLASIDIEGLLQFHQKQEAMATMCIKHYDYTIPFACVDYDDELSLNGILEKPTYQYPINAGVYVLNRKLIGLIPKDTFFDMPDLFSLAIEKGLTTKAFLLEEYWMDIGRPEDYMKSNRDLDF